MTGVVQTSPSAETVRNLRSVSPDLVSTTFVFKANSYVFKNGKGEFEYYSLGNISKKLRESKGLFFQLPKRPPLVEDGVILISGKVAIAVTADDIIRGRVCKSRALTTRALREFVYGVQSAGDSGADQSSSAEPVEELVVSTSDLQDSGDEGPGQDSWNEEWSEADMALEEQITSLYFAENPQALRRISDFAHSRQAVAGSSVPASDEGT